MKQLQQSADAILEKPVIISVDDPATTWPEKLLVKLRLRKEKRVFHVKPLVLGSLVRISKILLSIDKSKLTKEALENKQELFNINFELMQRHSLQMAEVVAIAVTNEKKEPSKDLVNFFLYKLTAKELMAVFTVIMQQMNVQDFISSIIGY